MKQRPYICISPDYDVLYEDCEGCCDCAYDDKITNDDPQHGPLFSIVVPGINEWVKRYEKNVDFGGEATNSHFDWKTWHYEGLCFAKAIWKQLPRCYRLFYCPPHEDWSGIIGKLEIDEHIDEVIERLRPLASKEPASLSVKEVVRCKAKRSGDYAEVSLSTGHFAVNLSIPLSSMQALHHWLNDIVAAACPVCSVQISGHDLFFARQTVGSHPEMGQFWISKSGQSASELYAYVNTQEFVRALYLSLMNELGFCLYDDINNYPTGDERVAVWKPYNDLKSPRVEAFIYGLPPCDDDKAPLVDETFVIDPDDCMFWDTMGIGCGDYDCLYSEHGDFDLDVPGLKKWSEPGQTYDGWWDDGWRLAQEVRRQLPDNIDIYYVSSPPIIVPNCHRGSEPEHKA